jgi:hypothetical protein
MKKSVLGAIALSMTAAVATVNVGLNSQSNNLSGLFLANVEALADYESPEVVIECSSSPGLIPYGTSLGKCWKNDYNFWQQLLGGVNCVFTGSINDACFYHA